MESMKTSGLGSGQGRKNRRLLEKSSSVAGRGVNVGCTTHFSKRAHGVPASHMLINAFGFRWLHGLHL